MATLEKTPNCLKFTHRPFSPGFITIPWLIGIPLGIMALSAVSRWILYLWWLPLFLFIGMVSGIAILLLGSQVMSYTFDRTLGKLVFKQQGLFKNQVVEHHLTDIVDVQLEPTFWHPRKHQKNLANYQICLLFRDGENLPLNLGQRSKLERFKVLREFLRLPPLSLRG